MHFHKWHYPTKNTRICLKCAEMQKQVAYLDTYWVLNMGYDEWLRAIEEDNNWEAAVAKDHARVVEYVKNLKGKMI